MNLIYKGELKQGVIYYCHFCIVTGNNKNINYIYGSLNTNEIEFFKKKWNNKYKNIIRVEIEPKKIIGYQKNK